MNQPKTTLGVLMRVIGFGQKEMAELVAYSRAGIQKILYRKGKLTDALAFSVAAKTGVSWEWLLSDELDKPPVDMNGKPYTKEVFKNYEAHGVTPEGEYGLFTGCRESHLDILAMVSDLLLAAYAQGKSSLIGFRIHGLLEHASRDLKKRDDLAKIALSNKLQPKGSEGSHKLVDLFEAKLRDHFKRRLAEAHQHEQRSKKGRSQPR